ncbi:hypothetical protein [Polymorphum gilvum]|uniref:Phasin domain-containing protein n=1 Tax=Polymorphum gilvum (strain LMG 25793 / CGMCC 1.9160 / SL003B-26A1) TaxID=991905 RepID=F2J334_POLGS|nr:hypothetical protein [Polymorphum gilvum]ADZ68904.1 hypothetical protein SL003B_0469 [Polymorphum gilvum SL003B-26A1]
MAGNSSRTAADRNPFQNIPTWPMMPLNEWNWAERGDRLEERAFESFEHMRRALIANTGKALEGQMDFVTQRLHADFECVKALSDCRMPDQAFHTLQGFFLDMWRDYEAQAQRNIELLHASLTENLHCAEEITDTAIETVAEIEQAAEEEFRPAKPARKAAPGAKAKAANPA